MARTGPANEEDVRRVVQYIYKAASSLPVSKTKAQRRYRTLEIRGSDVDLQRLHAESDWMSAPGSPAQFVDAVLDDAPFVCAGSSADKTITIPRRIATDGFLLGSTLIVPNPMGSLLAVNKAGEPSNRCEKSVIYRKYQIVEYDNATLQDQAARLFHLRDACHVPLKAVVFSGKKSLHGWFDVRGLTPDKQRLFIEYAVQATSADPAHKSQIQLTRLPFAVRPETGAVQSLVYFKS